MIVVVLFIGGTVYFVRTHDFSDKETESVPLPKIVITDPVSGASLAGDVQITVVANIDKVDEVTIFIDGMKENSCSHSPCVFLWQTGTRLEGKHTITATVEDSAKRIFSADPVSVIVSGSTAPATQKTSTSKTTQPTAAPAKKTPVTTATVKPASQALPQISAISVSNKASSTEDIAWKTNVLTTGRVNYGLDSLPLAGYTMHSDFESSAALLHLQSLAGLAPGKKYYYVIEARDAFGHTVTSSEQSFTVSAITFSSVKSSEISSAAAEIAWTTNFKTKGQVVYDIQTSSSGQYNYSTPLASDLSLLHTVGITALIPYTKYYYRVVAIDAAGNKNTSTEYSFTTSIITNVSVQKIYAGAAISWTTASATKSELRYGTQSSASATYPFSASDPTLLTYHTATLPNLDPNTTYYYVIIATDAAGKKTTSLEYSFVN